MSSVQFQPSGVRVDVSAGTPLLDAAREAGVDIEAPCGGEGICGKCIVRIVEGDVDSNSLGLLPRATVAEGYVLACRTKVLGGDVVVEVPQQQGRDGGRLLQDDERDLVRSELLPKNWEFDPLAVKWRLDVPAPQLEEGLGDLDRITRAVQRDWGPMRVEYPLSVIRTVAGALRSEDGIVTATMLRGPDTLHVIRLEAGNRTTRHYGIAIDLGTTTIAVQLVDLAMAEISGTRSEYNDQVGCGLDVISRINYARRAGGLDELRRALDTINRLIRQLTASRNVAADEISNAAISGNTTMVHLLLGLDPEYIRLEPYTPTVLTVPFLTAGEIGLDITSECPVCFSPCVGSYVGGDITAGLLCTDLATDCEQISLFIDVGTNGEIVIGNNDFLVTCACSAGPAFEGGGIECGMRAALGAIERVEIDPHSGRAQYATVGNVAPVGICGSGMITLLANLFLTGWIDAAGKLNRDRPCEAIQASGRSARYIIAPAEESGSGNPIVITELDIENIIRAKAAIYSACALLLEQLGLGFEDLAQVYIAGGFGRFLDIEKSTVIGLTPDIPRERFKYIGNSSLMGTYMVLVSQEHRRKQAALANRMTYMELNTDPSYMDQYTGALFLPHTDPDRFPSVAAQ
jgi:uncharacterized 2Fe-2S/4Fe-4S cluster protein (DUF4445 family)